MAQIVGIKRQSFKSKSGEEVSGFAVYFSEPLDGKDDFGVRTDRCWFDFSKMDPQLYRAAESGQAVTPVYNRYGKVDHFDIIG